jgi:hypothetical protein
MIKACGKCTCESPMEATRCLNCGASLVGEGTARILRHSAVVPHTPSHEEFHFRAIPIGLMAMGLMEAVLSGDWSAKALVRLFLALVMGISMLRGSLLAMKICRILLALAVIICGSVLALRWDRVEGTALVSLLVLTGFYAYGLVMLVLNRPLKQLYT